MNAYNKKLLRELLELINFFLVSNICSFIDALNYNDKFGS